MANHYLPPLPTHKLVVKLIKTNKFQWAIATLLFPRKQITCLTINEFSFIANIPINNTNTVTITKRIKCK